MKKPSIYNWTKWVSISGVFNGWSLQTIQDWSPTLIKRITEYAGPLSTILLPNGFPIVIGTLAAYIAENTSWTHMSSEEQRTAHYRWITSLVTVLGPDLLGSILIAFGYETLGNTLISISQTNLGPVIKIATGQMLGAGFNKFFHAGSKVYSPLYDQGMRTNTLNQ